jgi:hypothetical protein
MKKLMTLMLGMLLLFGSVSVVFGQDTPPKKSSKNKKKAPKTPKKDGGKADGYTPKKGETSKQEKTPVGK